MLNYLFLPSGSVDFGPLKGCVNNKICSDYLRASTEWRPSTKLLEFHLKGKLTFLRLKVNTEKEHIARRM